MSAVPVQEAFHGAVRPFQNLLFPATCLVAWKTGEALRYRRRELPLPLSRRDVPLPWGEAMLRGRQESKRGGDDASALNPAGTIDLAAGMTGASHAFLKLWLRLAESRLQPFRAG